jgi:hypothetical protein
MRMRHLWAWVAIGLSYSGCTLANLTPQARFSEAAYTLNDASRWGQVDLALQHVSPRYQARFTERHREWGENVSIADVDLVRMQVAEDRQSATSEISLNWFDDGGVMVKSSVISQKWETEHGKFKLVDEKVRRGDPSVFAAPEPAQGS